MHALTIALVLGLSAPGLPKSHVYSHETQLELIAKRLATFRDSTIARRADGCSRPSFAVSATDTPRIGVYFGALDVPTGHLLDASARDALEAHLTSDCPPGYHACGFVRAPASTTLTKPWGDSQALIELHASSLVGHVEDLPAHHAAQERQSALVGERFLGSLRQDDVVIYLGHARFGTGPGFSFLAPFSAEWLATYLDTPSRTAMLEALSGARPAPELVALLGCSTERFYANAVRAAAPDSTLLVTTGFSLHHDLVVEAANVIDTTLGLGCYAPATPHYALHESSAAVVGPLVPPKLGLLSVALHVLLLPLVVLVARRGSKVAAPETLLSESFGKDGLLLVVLPLVGLALYEAEIFTGPAAESHSAPVLFGVSGLCLLVRFSPRGRELIAALTETARASALPLLVVLVIRFLPDLVAAPSAAVMTAGQAAAFIGSYVFFTPFARLSTEILMHPLRRDDGVRPALRITVFVAMTMSFYFVLALTLLSLNAQVVPYKEALLAFFVFLQGAALLVYRLTRSLTQAAIVQALALGLIFSEGLHTLFY